MTSPVKIPLLCEKEDEDFEVKKEENEILPDVITTQLDIMQHILPISVGNNNPITPTTTTLSTSCGEDRRLNGKCDLSGMDKRRQCPQNPLHFDILWLPRTAMKSIESDTSDCVLVVGVSRPKMAAALLTVMLLSLFITFHVLYDSAVYSLQNTAVFITSDDDPTDNINPKKLTRARIIEDTGGGIESTDVIISPDNNFNGYKNFLHKIYLFKQRKDEDDKDPDNEIEENVDEDELAITSNKIHVHFPRTSRRLPQAIIIGVRKCGTRALLEMLYLHPMIQKAAGEVHFFDRDENYEKGLEWYRRKMPHSFRGQITIEKSPSYFVTPEVPERIRAMNASIKILLIVREPVTRAISDYTQLRSHATASAAAALTASTSTITTPPPSDSPTPPEPLSPQQQHLLATLSATNAKSFEQLAILPDGTINTAYKPLAISMYHTFMHRWLEIFKRDQILIVNGDMLIEDPVPQLQKIETFLGIEPRIGKHNFYFNETKGFFCLRNDTQDKCLRETKGRRHPRVDPLIISKLRKFFSEHNQKFYELVGEDFGWPEE